MKYQLSTFCHDLPCRLFAFGDGWSPAVGYTIIIS